MSRGHPGAFCMQRGCRLVCQELLFFSLKGTGSFWVQPLYWLLGSSVQKQALRDRERSPSFVLAPWHIRSKNSSFSQNGCPMEPAQVFLEARKVRFLVRQCTLENGWAKEPGQPRTVFYEAVRECDREEDLSDRK